MRNAYAKYFEPILIAQMRRACPDFQYMDSTVRRKAGNPVYYGPGKLTGFCWSPRAGGPLFVLVFRVPNGKDSVEAACEWSDSGRIVKEQPLLHDGLFDAAVLQRPHARALVQALSQAAGDGPDQRVVFWNFWTPSADPMDTDRWFREALAEEERNLSDEEARSRVEMAVRTAVADVNRLALPWFQRKLAYAFPAG